LTEKLLRLVDIAQLLGILYFVLVFTIGAVGQAAMPGRVAGSTEGAPGDVDRRC
jgi:hypothetical protein